MDQGRLAQPGRFVSPAGRTDPVRYLCTLRVELLPLRHLTASLQG